MKTTQTKKSVAPMAALAIILAATLMTAEKADAGRVERFVVTGAIGAGIGQAIGHNTGSTLIGAAAALLLDGYLNPSFHGNRQRVQGPGQHFAHYRPAPPYPQEQVTTTVIIVPQARYYPRRHIYRYLHKKHRRHCWQHEHRRHYRW